MTSRDFDYLTLRNVTAYNPDGSYVSTGYVLTAGPKGVASWTVGPTGMGGGSTGPTGPAGGGGSLPPGTCYSDYIFWNNATPAWEVGSTKVHLGCDAGAITQGSNAVAIGNRAGNDNQGDLSVAIGNQAGETYQYQEAVAIGWLAGSTGQGASSVAIGANSAAISQGSNSVAIGNEAGSNNQAPLAVAIGWQAGNGTQGDFAVAIGKRAGYSYQGGQGIAIGEDAGYYTQGPGSIAIGWQSGCTDQQSTAIAIGSNAGAMSQQPSAVAIGTYAGNLSQGIVGIAIGFNAGFSYQGSSAIALGTLAGQYSQGNNAIAIGEKAGNTTQGISAIALGTIAGQYSQGNNAIAIGENAGNTTQGISAIAIGQYAGYVNQGVNAYALGVFAGNLDQGQYAVAIGNYAGQQSQGQKSIAVGLFAGDLTQGENSIAIGNNAAVRGQLSTSIAIGYEAGYRDQQASTIAIGCQAGFSNQRDNAIAIGTLAGQDTQGTGGVAIGYRAGFEGQGSYAIAIGYSAGDTAQGENAIAIGNLAGQAGQLPSTIVLNAQGIALNTLTQNACYVAPIRVESTSNVLYYSTGTKEITYGVVPSGGAAISTFSTLCVSSIIMNNIIGCVNISSFDTPVVYSTSGTYNISVPYCVSSFQFEMIGAGGFSGILGGTGGTGGYMKGTITIPSGTTSIKVVVGSVDITGVAPSGASYINVPGTTLFAMAGAGGSGGSGTSAGGYGGGGTFATSVENGGNGVTLCGPLYPNGGTTVGGASWTTICLSNPATFGQTYAGNYEQSLGGSGGGSTPGGSGYSGGGAGLNGDGAGGGSSYKNSTYTTLTASYNGSAVPGGVLYGTFGRAGNIGYVSITFNYNCSTGTSVYANGDIIGRNFYSISSLTSTLNVSTTVTTSSLNVSTGNLVIGAIGAGPSTFALEINSAGTTSTFTAGYLYNSTGIQSSITTGVISVRSASGIWAPQFYASSDMRIKTNIKEIVDSQALGVLRQLKPVCYSYIDYVKNHNQMEYGFIAQDVKPLLPHAVRTERDFLPNVYDFADFSALDNNATMVTLRSKTLEHIKVNDVIKMFDLNDQQIVYPISEVNHNYFTIEANLSTIVSDYEPTEQDIKNGIKKNTVFVYGTQVDDFHVLDKHAIYSVSIGAMQELDRILLQQQQTIKELEDKVTLLLTDKPSA